MNTIKHHWDKPRFRQRGPEQSSGVALVIVLGCVLLMTIVVVAYLSGVQNEAHGTATSTSIVQTRILAENAVETIVRDLRDEMLAGAANDPQVLADGTTDPMEVAPYNPNLRNLTPGAWWAAVPARVIAAGMTSVGYANLVKQSLAGQACYPGTSPPAIYTAKTLGGATTGKSRASRVPTTAASLDGRSIATTRWSASGLLNQDLTDSQVPNWVYINRRGLLEDGSVLDSTTPNVPSPGLTTARDSSSGNENFVVGRVAYNMYDTGGLLNANVVGYPSTLDPAADPVVRKGSAAWADGRAIGMTASQIDNLVNWRNNLSQGVFSPFENYVHNWGEMKGFSMPYTNATASGTTVNPRTDGYLMGRQDLIRYWLHDNKAASYSELIATHPEQRAILAKLTGFSASSTTPAIWAYGTNRPAIQQPASGGNITTGLDTTVTHVRWHDLINRYFPKNKVNTAGLVRSRKSPGQTTGSVAFDRTVTAQKGEPFVNSRFPLSRISLLTSGGTDAASIQRFFGLTKLGDGSWWYYHGATAGGPGSAAAYGRIMSLAEVSADPQLYKNGTSTTNAPREPDFFELLQAAIDTGSTGKSCGTASGTTAHFMRDTISQYQIIQLGANILSQADPSGIPIRIAFDPATLGAADPGYRVFSGIKNLPYLTRIRVILVQIAGPPVNTDSTDYIYGMYIQPEVWNPHDSSVPAPADGPQFFRVVADSTPQTLYGLADGGRFTDTQLIPDSTGIIFTSALNVSEPVLLSRTIPNVVFTGATTPGAIALNAPPHTSDLLGMNAGALRISPPAQPLANGQHFTLNNYSGLYNSLVRFQMQYAASASGPWTTYAQYENSPVTAASYVGILSPDEGTVSASNVCAKTVYADPRTQRFGWFGMNGTQDVAGFPFNETVRPTSASGYGSWTMRFPSTASPPILPGPEACGWVLGPQSFPTGQDAKAIGTICENRKGFVTYYSDADAVYRGGDGYYFAGSGSPSGLMLYTGNTTSRPVVLNRPFKSVGELGYVFRDTPLKSVDFFTENSGDSGLLDTFCIDEQPDNGVVNGHVSLNTRQPDVLAALLSTTMRIEPDPGTGVGMDTAAEQQTIAAAIIALTSGTGATQGPITNRSEIATRIEPALIAQLGSGTTSSNRNWVIKRRAESVVRALADSTEAGTWNLMVDMIVQSGRFPSGRGDASAGSFLVSGETRQWVHLAIDRGTGKVIASLVEPVYE